MVPVCSSSRMPQLDDLSDQPMFAPGAEGAGTLRVPSFTLQSLGGHVAASTLACYNTHTSPWRIISFTAT
jgi:hypothetical protein